MGVDARANRAWLVWGAAVVVYVAAVFHRGSLGVAGPQALDRFGVGPTALSTFTVLQVGIYAAMQIPTGLLVDRFGARRILGLAALLLAAGQTLFAVAGTYPLVLLARSVLGMGDAMTWVSVLRLVAAHFPPRQYALVVTISSALGAIGGVTATFPLTLALGELGWSATFLLAATATLGCAASATALVRNNPDGQSPQEQPREQAALILRRVRATWAVPGTRLAFWVHFSTMFAANALSLLWGFPYLVNGLGLPADTASLVLSTLIVGQVVGGPLVGALIGRRPAWRMPMVLSYLLVNAVSWGVLLGWSGGQPPLGVVVAVFAVFATGGPMSSIAFALARDYNPLRHVGTATGVANSGGHSATAVAVLIIGLLLDLSHTSTPTGDYRIAMLAPVLMLLAGGWRTAVWWRRARSVVLAAQARGEHVPVVVKRHRWDRRRSYRTPAALG